MTQSILAEADKLINGQRAIDYGDAVETHQAVADMFNSSGKLPGVTLRASDVVLIMRLLKIRRSVVTPTHRDSYVDEGGYTDIGYRCALAEAGDT
jgi:hypothetical protein